jgi:hypothetical protein
MAVLAGVCFVVSAMAQLGGIALLVQQAQSARSELAAWEAANPERHEAGSFDQLMKLNPIVQRLLGDQTRPRQAVVLIVVSVVVGTVGNFLTL